MTHTYFQISVPWLSTSRHPAAYGVRIYDNPYVVWKSISEYFIKVE